MLETDEVRGRAVQSNMDLAAFEYDVQPGSAMNVHAMPAVLAFVPRVAVAGRDIDCGQRKE
jgi:hypothetical protein